MMGTGGLVAEVGLRRGAFALGAAFAAGPGEVVAVLGPNGAGKTSLLRALAGLEELDAGRITLSGRLLADPTQGVAVPPEGRCVGVVFQDYLLFPHLTARDNVAFGLRSRGRSRVDARRVAGEWLERVGLGARVDARVRHLSGGEAQRVALARALATDPDLLLLDEPLAALDAGTRLEVRRDMRRYLESFAGVAVLVTHDPLDALALASSVVILDGGEVVQSGPLPEVTARPRSAYVADLIGVNLLRGHGVGTTVRLDVGRDLAVAGRPVGDTFVLVAPRAVSLHPREPDGSARNRWEAVIEGLDLMGDRVRVRLGGPLRIVAEVTPAAVAELGLVEGRHVWAAVKATEIDCYPA